MYEDVNDPLSRAFREYHLLSERYSGQIPVREYADFIEALGPVREEFEKRLQADLRRQVFNGGPSF